jgi:PAS domain S-box-containing protein
MFHILYVDDDVVLLDVAEDFLNEYDDFDLAVASSVDEARKAMQLNDFDVIISDCQMPNQDGIQFLKELRAEGNAIPFILFTGKGREEVVIEALNSGATFYLQKGGDPVAQFAELAHKIRISVERKAAEEKILSTNLELEAALSAAQLGNWKLDFLRGSFVVNDRVWTIYGTDAEREGGYVIPLVRFTKEFVHPEDLNTFSREMMQILEDGSRVMKGTLEFRTVRRDGAVRIINAIYGVVRDERGQAIVAHGVLQDITDRIADKARLGRLNRDLVAIKEMNRCLVMATTEGKLLDDICRIGCELAGYRLAWVGMAMQDENRSVVPVARAGYDNGYVDSVQATWGEGERGQGPTGRAIRSGETVAEQDWTLSPEMPWKDLFLRHGYRSSVAIPLKDKTSDSAQAFGALMLYSTEANGFNAQEMALLEEMANDLAYGIIGLRAKEIHRKAEEALRNSEEKYRSIFAAERDAVFLVDVGTGSILDANESASKMFGYSLNELRGMRNTDISAEPEETRQATSSQNWVPRRWQRRKDGTLFPVEISVSRFDLDGRPVMVAAIRDIEERLRIEHRLQERIKELQSFYTLARIGHGEGDLEAKLKELVDQLPLSWQHPEMAGARLKIEDGSYSTKLFRETPWRQRSVIRVNGREAGSVEISYLQEMPVSDEGPFMKEERFLLDAVADEIAILVENELARKAHR